MAKNDEMADMIKNQLIFSTSVKEKYSGKSTNIKIKTGIITSHPLAAKALVGTHGRKSGVKNVQEIKAATRAIIGSLP